MATWQVPCSEPLILHCVSSGYAHNVGQAPSCNKSLVRELQTHLPYITGTQTENIVPFLFSLE